MQVNRIIITDSDVFFFYRPIRFVRENVKTCYIVINDLSCFPISIKFFNGCLDHKVALQVSHTVRTLSAKRRADRANIQILNPILTTASNPI